MAQGSPTPFQTITGTPEAMGADDHSFPPFLNLKTVSEIVFIHPGQHISMFTKADFITFPLSIYCPLLWQKGVYAQVNEFSSTSMVKMQPPPILFLELWEPCPGASPMGCHFCLLEASRSNKTCSSVQQHQPNPPQSF